MSLISYSIFRLVALVNILHHSALSAPLLSGYLMTKSGSKDGGTSVYKSLISVWINKCFFLFQTDPQFPLQHCGLQSVLKVLLFDLIA